MPAVAQSQKADAPVFVHKLHEDLFAHCRQVGLEPHPGNDFFTMDWCGFMLVFDFHASDATFMSVILAGVAEVDERVSGMEIEALCGRLNRSVKCACAFVRGERTIDVGIDLRHASAGDFLRFMSRYLRGLTALAREVWFELEKMRAALPSSSTCH